MKKFRLHTAALALFVATSFVSCSEDDSTLSFTTKQSLVSAVTGATTADINQEIVLTVTFGLENNCGLFDKFIETTADKTKTITVQSKYAGTTCGTTPVTKTEPYKFKAATAGTYVLKFKKSATEFVTHNVVVD